MKISVIIPCRNEKRHIGRFLDSVLTQDLEPGWELEILVADGLSDDGTREALRQYRHVRVIDNPGRIVSTGLNAAIGAATGEVVIRLDVHTSYAPDYIHQCVRLLQQSGADNVGGPWVAKEAVKRTTRITREKSTLCTWVAGPGLSSTERAYLIRTWCGTRTMSLTFACADWVDESGSRRESNRPTLRGIRLRRYSGSISNTVSGRWR